MEVTEAIRTRLEVRSYSDEPVDAKTRSAILDAARLAPSGKNLQHWQFVLVDDLGDLDRLAEISTSGDWIDGADFAVVVLTDPTYPYHQLDAGRTITHMQFAAWDHGVGSCIYTGYDDAEMRSFLDIPADYAISAVVGFGHPRFDVESVEGQKDRAPLEAVAHDGRFDEPLEELE